MSSDPLSSSALSPVAVSAASAVIEPAAAVGRRHHVIQPGPPVAIVVAFVLCYRDVFGLLYQQWTTIDANSHGFLIPFLSGYLVWNRRHVLACTPWRPAPVAGLALLAAAMAAFALGSLSETVTIQELSMLPAIAGSVLVLYGWRVLRHVWLAIVYLGFMMPLLDPVAPVHPPLQSFAATVGGALLSWGGIPVLRTDLMIYMPNATLEVARACSGINNLIAMLAIGIVIAELTVVRRRLRLAFVAFALLVALFANPVRVALIGALLYLGYDSYLPGDGHEIQGLIVSGGAFLLLVASASVLARMFDRPRPAAGPSLMASPAGGGLVAPPRLWRPALACVAVLMLGALHPALIAHAMGTPGLQAAPPAAHVGEWFADHTRLATGDLRILPASLDPRIYRRRAASDVAALVTTPLFGAGPRGETMAWLVGVGEPITVTPPDSNPVQVNRSVLRSSGGTLGVLYWYQVDGEIFHNRIEARLRGAFSRLLRRPEPAIVVAVVAPTAREKAILSAAHMDFARELIAAGQ